MANQKRTHRDKNSNSHQDQNDYSTNQDSGRKGGQTDRTPTSDLEREDHTDYGDYDIGGMNRDEDVDSRDMND